MKQTTEVLSRLARSLSLEADCFSIYVGGDTNTRCSIESKETRPVELKGFAGSISIVNIEY
jgi:hypothetical protein